MGTHVNPVAGCPLPEDTGGQGDPVGRRTTLAHVAVWPELLMEADAGREPTKRAALVGAPGP